MSRVVYSTPVRDDENRAGYSRKVYLSDGSIEDHFWSYNGHFHMTPVQPPVPDTTNWGVVDRFEEGWMYVKRETWAPGIWAGMEHNYVDLKHGMWTHRYEVLMVDLENARIRLSGTMAMPDEPLYITGSPVEIVDDRPFRMVETMYGNLPWPSPAVAAVALVILILLGWIL